MAKKYFTLVVFFMLAGVAAVAQNCDGDCPQNLQYIGSDINMDPVAVGSFGALPDMPASDPDMPELSSDGGFGALNISGEGVQEINVSVSSQGDTSWGGWSAAQTSQITGAGWAGGVGYQGSNTSFAELGARHFMNSFGGGLVIMSMGWEDFGIPAMRGTSGRSLGASSIYAEMQWGDLPGQHFLSRLKELANGTGGAGLRTKAVKAIGEFKNGERSIQEILRDNAALREDMMEYGERMGNPDHWSHGINPEDGTPQGWYDNYGLKWNQFPPPYRALPGWSYGPE